MEAMPMSAERLFVEAAKFAAEHYGPPVLEAMTKFFENVSKSSDPLVDAQLAAQITAAEQSTTTLLRLALKKTVRRNKP
jgi:hypothetical protein